MKKLFFLLCLVSHFVIALPTETGIITSLQIHKAPNSQSETSRRFIVSIGESTISENDCGADIWTSYINEQVDNLVYSTLLAAYLSGRPVKIEGSASEQCMGGGMLIRNIYPL